MSVHQIIYTSCMRGIQGVNDGQQVFSYDKEFGAVEQVKGFFAYQQPALPSGVAMSEELALTMPRNFTYRPIDNNQSAFALTSYLGRDYMGASGRFGNFLSHVVTADTSELKKYPCEYFDSDMLRKSMVFEEVNSPNPPEYLPVPELTVGEVVSEESVIEFLGQEERMNLFHDMLYALYSFEEEKKRLVICDTRENIIFWIAALEYCLPLEQARAIPFSTYVYDPSLSNCQICGVEPQGTRFTAEVESHHFTFNILENRCPTFEKDPEYCDFISNAFAFAFHCIGEFHNFLEMGYDFKKINCEITHGYTLYTVLADGVGMVQEENLLLALEFAEKYGKSAEKSRIARSLITQNHLLLTAERKIFLPLLETILKQKRNLSPEEMEIVKKLIVHRILQDFIAPDCDPEVFRGFYQDISKICEMGQVSVATELMEDKNRGSLMSLLSQNVENWKIAFYIKIISSYVKDRHLPISQLSPEQPLGQLYYGILRELYQNDKEQGFLLATLILKEFSKEPEYLVEMTFHVESVLLDLSDEKVPDLWKYFNHLMAKLHKGAFGPVYGTLQLYQRESEMKELYIQEMESSDTVEQCKKVFQYYYDSFLQGDSKRLAVQGEEIAELYYGRLCEMPEEKALPAKEQLFQLLHEEKISIEHAEHLLKVLLRHVEVGKLNPKDEHLVEVALEYLCMFQKKAPTEKLYLLYLLGQFHSVNNRPRGETVLEELEELSQTLDMVPKSKGLILAYFESLSHVMLKYFNSRELLGRCFALFPVDSDCKYQTVELWAKEFLKEAKDEKNFRFMAEYFAFVSDLGERSLLDLVGEMWKKQNKARQNEWEDCIRRKFAKDEKVLKDFQKMKESHEGGSILSNLFKKNK